MARQTYTPYNWFWAVADQPDVVYSSQAVDYLALDSEVYTTWLAQGNRATSIPTEAELIVVLKQQNPDAIPHTVAGNAVRVANKVEALWKAADAYTSSRISGVAIGILTLGVMQQLPKSLAIAGWSASLWNEYYIRKTAITPNTEPDLDFSNFGNLPFTIPEMQIEVGM